MQETEIATRIEKIKPQLLNAISLYSTRLDEPGITELLFWKIKKTMVELDSKLSGELTVSVSAGQRDGHVKLLFHRFH